MHYKDPALTEIERALTYTHLHSHTNAHGGVFLNLWREQDNQNLSNNLFTKIDRRYIVSERAGLVILYDFLVTIMTFNGLKGMHHVKWQKKALKK